jgi:hypothetical protein
MYYIFMVQRVFQDSFSKPLVTIHGAVRSTARPPSDNVMVPVGIQPIDLGFLWISN